MADFPFLVPFTLLEVITFILSEKSTYFARFSLIEKIYNSLIVSLCIISLPNSHQNNNIQSMSLI